MKRCNPRRSSRSLSELIYNDNMSRATARQAQVRTTKRLKRRRVQVARKHRCSLRPLSFTLAPGRQGAARERRDNTNSPSSGFVKAVGIWPRN
jgi:hypothetical protein